MSRYLKSVVRPALCVLMSAVLLACLGPQPKKDVPYVPTPESTVLRMLDLADAKPDDVVYDLGSGDGRIVITAAKTYGVRKGVGVDIDPVRVRESRLNAERAGVADRVAFVEGNVFTFDFSEATVLTMYLLPEVNLRLRPRVLAELKPGTRVVSHQFDMGDWRPDERRTGRRYHVYLWVVPARVSGAWEWADGAHSYRLMLAQRYQKVVGSLFIDGRETPIQRVRLKGDTLAFEVPGRDGRVLGFEARVKGAQMDARFNETDVVIQRAG